ncbi:amino acid adenylation domain-containing protein [Streptomonospora alba]|uniref:amino acid adenylation domain-containing protein n=1 Tax=Streptomonospora alba TaxID=183763 RepID=UPI00069A1847|nr:amino acid adenylation domain-containing protein [Streptomonospora alba]
MVPIEFQGGESMSTRAASLNEVIEMTARDYPDNVALSDTVSTLTYEQLLSRASAMATGLADQGVRKGDMVGLLVERSVDVVIGILAILRCGAAYVPIDPSYPTDRQEFVLRDSGVSLVVGRSGALGSAEWAGTVRTHEADSAGDGREPGSGESAVEVGPADPAYVIYTSGSTGVPKGCVVTHGNVVSLLHAALPLLTVNADDRWSIFHSFSFDVSVWELWAALATGAKAVVVPHEATQVPASLVHVLVQEEVTVLSQVPSVFRYFSSLQRYPAAQLRYVIFAGENIDLGSVGRFWSQCDGYRPEVINMYGITETTVHSTFRRITESDLSSEGSPIGTALPHLTIELRSEQPPHRPVEDGEIGEMWVSGDGVARGYLNRPQLTAQKFVTDGSSRTRKRYYRSGDLARRMPDGELEYRGRNDHQVKLRGFRVELGEIESAIRAQAGVLDAAVCVVTRRTGSQLLVAAVVPIERESEQNETIGRIGAKLAAKLPRYMIPERCFFATSLPLTLSGKLDRNELEKMALEAVAQSGPGRRPTAPMITSVTGNQSPSGDHR